MALATQPERRGTSALVHGPTRLDVTTVPRLELTLAGTPLPIVSRKARALVAYLAISDQVETRERLVGLFWSETPEEKARASLRQVIHEIREAFRAADFDGFRIDKRSLSLDRTRLTVDLRDIIAAADNGHAHPKLVDTARLPETLLQDYDNVDPAFRTWLQAKRQTLQDRLLRGLEASMRAAADASLREAVANAIMHLDPSHEEACRYLIQARADRGDFGAALRLYKGLWDLLESEFDVEPSAETQKLVVGIRSMMTPDDQFAAFRTSPPEETPGQADHAPGSPALLPLPSAPVHAPPRNMVITIGAFDIAGTSPDQRYLVHGFRLELVASLVRFREWYVRDDSPDGTPGVARPDAMAQYRIDASALTTPKAIRLVLTLRDTQTGIFVWSDRYDITLANWFEAQQAIIRRIAVSLNVHVSVNRLNRVTSEPGIPPDIYDRWLRAQVIIRSFSPGEWKQTAEIFQATIAEAPHFSPAYSSLAQINTGAHIAQPGLFRTSEREQEALRLARMAVQLDPVDSRAQLALGWALQMAGSHSSAEIHMGLATELNENDPWVLISAALSYGFAGQSARAHDLAHQARLIAPSPFRTHWVYESTVNFIGGDYEGCVAASQRSGDAVVSNVAWRAAAQYHLGRVDDARRDLRAFLDALRPQWKGAVAATDLNLFRWLLHLYPIAHADDWQRLRDGLVGAGAPDAAAIEHRAAWRDLA